MSRKSRGVRQRARETHIPVGGAGLYARSIGQGKPVIVLHGGPGFDHSYLLPDLDRLSDFLDLIYYDQRGRGMSGDGVSPQDVTMASEVEDLDRVRQYFGLDKAGLLAHSWGCVLALEYAIVHPKDVSFLILMNPAPASRQDHELLMERRRERSADDEERLRAIASTPGYKDGAPDTVAAYRRIHFSRGVRRRRDLDRIISQLGADSTRERILKRRAIGHRLMQQTWLSDEYDLVPRLDLKIPSLVLHGEDDDIPLECAARIAEAMPQARLVTLERCGHFSYLECPTSVYEEIRGFVLATSVGNPGE